MVFLRKFELHGNCLPFLIQNELCEVTIVQLECTIFLEEKLYGLNLLLPKSMYRLQKQNEDELFTIFCCNE